MSKIVTRFVNASSPAELRRTFETAIAKVQHNGKPLSSAQTPIVPRKATALRDDPAAEKQALTDAARALAQLWNISPSLVR